MTKIDKHVLTCLFKFVCPECNTKLKELENDDSIIFCPACGWAWSKKKSVKYS
jgi:Zn-finger nucleic acid-binding protein